MAIFDRGPMALVSSNYEAWLHHAMVAESTIFGCKFGQSVLGTDEKTSQLDVWNELVNQNVPKIWPCMAYGQYLLTILVDESPGGAESRSPRLVNHSSISSRHTSPEHLPRHHLNWVSSPDHFWQYDLGRKYDRLPKLLGFDLLNDLILCIMVLIEYY